MRTKVCFLGYLMLLTTACKSTKQQFEKPAVHDGWRSLLSMDYQQNWELFLGVPHGTVSGITGVDPSSDGKKGTPLGLNNDPKQVFTVKNINGEPVLHISGEIYGALSTLQDYENYHLSLQFKWGEKKWPPRLNRKKDSGILYHCLAPHGRFWNVWMQSQEFQVQETDVGDFYAL
ncbi:MAG: family 16 glycoside hydrolase, partial [Bacteroidota bacterium]